MPAPYRRASALLMLSIFAQGCMTWRRAPEPPRPFLEHERPNRVRVTRNDGVVMSVERPFIANDEIRGFNPRCWRSLDQARTRCAPHPDTVSVAAFDDVWSLDVRRFDPGRTLGATGVTLALVGLVALLIDVSFTPPTWNGTTF